MKKTNAIFTVLFGCHYATVLIVVDFYSRFLKDFGYSDIDIGLAVMWSMLSSLLCQLIIGYFADRFGYMKQIVLIALTVIIVSFPLLFKFSDVPVFVIVFSVIAVGPLRTLGSIWDSWVTQEGSVDYGRVRAVGAISYAVLAFILGFILTAMGNRVAIFFLAGFFIVIACGIFNLKNPQVLEGADKVSLGKSLSYLANNRSFLLMLVGSFLYSLTISSVLTYFPILMAEAGGTQADLGATMFIMSTLEFIVMMFITKLKDKFGVSAILTLGFFGCLAMNLSFAMSTKIWQIYLSCLFRCVSLALVIPGIVVFITERVNIRYLTTALLVNQSVMIISMMIANPLCGLLSEKLGLNTMFAIAGLPVFFAGIAFILIHRKQKVRQSET